MNEGMINKGGLSHVVSEIVTGRKTGDLQCLRPHEERRLYFREGELIFASTNMDAERIGQLVLNAGLVDPIMLEAVLKVVGPGKRTGRIMVAEGLLTPERLIKIVESYIRRITIAIFSWKDGRVRFTESENTDIEDVVIDIATADVFLDAARHIPLTSIAIQALGNLQEPLRFAMDPILRFQKIKFTEEEASVLNCINNFTTTEEICEVSPLDKDATLKFLCGLMTAGILERPSSGMRAAESVIAAAPSVSRNEFEIPDDLFSDPLVPDDYVVTRPATLPSRAPAIPQRPVATRPAAPTRPQPAAPPATPPPKPASLPAPVFEPPPPEVENESPYEEPPEQSSPPSPPPPLAPPPEARSSEQDAAEKGQIQEVHRRLSLMDYYTLLEVDKKSSDEEIRKSYFMLAKKYHPDRAAASHLRDLKKLMEEIFAQINKAYEVLRNPERRSAYDDRGARAEFEEREGISKETDEQIADRNFRMAKTLYEQHKFAEAIQLLKAATRLNPIKGNYFFLLANAQVKNNNRREAEETYLKAIELDRFNSDIYASLGLLYKTYNMQKRAEGMFLKALQLNDNHPVALREIAAMKPEEKGLLKSILRKASDKLQK